MRERIDVYNKVPEKERGSMRVHWIKSRSVFELLVECVVKTAEILFIIHKQLKSINLEQIIAKFTGALQSLDGPHL